MQPQSDEQQPARHQIAISMARIATAMRSASWQQAGSQHLTPTQAGVLSLLHAAGKPLRLSEVAGHLGIKPATASDSVSSLVEKRLVRRGPARGDGRAVAITLTGAGQAAAEEASKATDFLSDVIAGLTEDEQNAMQRGLVKLIHGLQERQELSPSQMCLSCRSFRPYTHARSQRPHHCAYYDAAFRDADLRVECPAYQAAGPDLAAAVWHRFITGELREGDL